MRESRYNVLAVDGEGRNLAYNAANGAFVELDDDALACLRAGEGEAAGLLSELGFLTDDTPDDELERIRARFATVRHSDEMLGLSFVPTYACNYRCPYCYEHGHNSVKGKMDVRVMDAIEAFVAARYAEMGFGRLSVQWYGGDPSLALDVVEELSGRLIAWCDERGIAYDAMMLTNANRIDEAAAELLARCRVNMAYLTIDGPEELHNRRRIAADGSNSYQRNIAAARALMAQGITVTANMNVDKVSWPHYVDLRNELFVTEGIALGAVKLCDYGHFFGQAPFAKPDFDLFTHEEFFQTQFEEFASRPHDAVEMRSMLEPIDRFCTGQLDNYFVIDLLGDVYNCDGRVGETDYMRFNILDDPATWRLGENVFDATHDEKCSACELLPMCYGSCYWERVCNGMPCHPFKTTIGGYLGVYRTCFADDDADDCTAAGVRVLARPAR